VAGTVTMAVALLPLCSVYTNLYMCMQIAALAREPWLVWSEGCVAL